MGRTLKIGSAVSIGAPFTKEGARARPCVLTGTRGTVVNRHHDDTFVDVGNVSIWIETRRLELVEGDMS